MYSELIRISGKVQGVGFRAYVERCAEAAGVRGQVWNYPGSGVGVIAQHEEISVVKEFRQRVKEGPGEVASVAWQPYRADAFEDFRIVSFAPE